MLAADVGYDTGPTRRRRTPCTAASLTPPRCQNHVLYRGSAPAVRRDGMDLFATCIACWGVYLRDYPTVRAERRFPRGGTASPPPRPLGATHAPRPTPLERWWRPVGQVTSRGNGAGIRPRLPARLPALGWRDGAVLGRTDIPTVQTRTCLPAILPCIGTSDPAALTVADDGDLGLGCQSGAARAVLLFCLRRLGQVLAESCGGPPVRAARPSLGPCPAVLSADLRPRYVLLSAHLAPALSWPALACHWGVGGS